MSLPSLPMSASPQLGSEPPGSRRSPFGPALDLTLRVAGGLLSVVGAVLTGVLELLLSTLRVGGYLIGVSAVIAVLANVALSWFAYRTVGRKAAVALPALIWFVLMMVAAGGTDEGDILLAGDNWVALALIVAGSMAFAVMAFRLILAPRR
ncbi:hypothetical protein GCM10027290_19650 [Micromonospora sonneratiae]